MQLPEMIWSQRPQGDQPCRARGVPTMADVCRLLPRPCGAVSVGLAVVAMVCLSMLWFLDHTIADLAVVWRAAPC